MLPDFRLERKHAVVLEQHHRLIRQLARVGAMLGAVEFLLIDLCVGNHVRRIEHAELDSRREQANQARVESALRQISLLHGVDVGLVDRLAETRGERDALVIHAAQDGDRCALRLRRTIAMVGRDVADGIAVGDDVSLESPLAAQLILQQVLIGACRLAVDRVVGAHDRAGLAFDDGSAERGLVGIDLVVFAHVHIGEVACRLRSAVHGEVLRRGNREVVLRIVALQSGHVGNTHAAGEERIFAVGLLPAAPARIAEDVQIGRPEIQASHDAGVAFALRSAHA